VSVRKICATDPYMVDIHAPLDRVVHEMAARHVGSAIVLRNGKLAGIFTVTDACRILGNILVRRFRNPDDDEAA
jgi:acetoin utilization protein AcuB